MIERHSYFRRLVLIVGLAIALSELVGATPARAQSPDNLPCSSRREKDACLAECTGENFLFQCTCLFDNGASDPQDVSCPVGGTCCWNMPCETRTEVGEFECLRLGGSVDGLTPKHCGWTLDAETNIGSCGCVPPLVHSNYTLTDFVVFNPSLAYDAPYDCRCPFTTDEQWLRLDVCNPPGVSNLAIRLSFAKPSVDSIGLRGTLAVPAGFSAAGATLEVSIGGVVKTFTLDARGRAKVGTDRAQLTVKAKKGVVLAQDAKLTVRFTQGSFASSLDDFGLVDATVADVAVSVPVEIKLNSTMYAKTQPQTYRAKAGKTGSAR